MEALQSFAEFFLHLDTHLTAIVSQFGVFSYLLLFLIIFLETGVVVVPFLPGDSLLFVAGTLASRDALNIWWLYVLLVIAAIIGDTVNYWIGHFFGPKVFSRENSRIFKKEYLEKTRAFYEKHGGKTIILARFLPIIRTFAPFVAGVGRMHYGEFLFYNIAGGLLWVTLFVWGGYFFGNIPLIHDNFETAIFVIIFLSVLPAIIEFIRHKREKKKHRQESTTFGKIEKTFEKQHLAD